MKPLTLLTRKDHKWKWGELEKEAFEKLKSEVTKEPVLMHSDPNKPYHLETDASGVAMGAVLSQRHNDGYLHPIAFLSKSFTETQMDYDTHDKELLAIIESLQHWRIFLEGIGSSGYTNEGASHDYIRTLPDTEDRSHQQHPARY